MCMKQLKVTQDAMWFRGSKNDLYVLKQSENGSYYVETVKMHLMRSQSVPSGHQIHLQRDED